MEATATTAAPDELIELLGREERILVELARLADEQQWAIVHANYESMERVSQELDAAAFRLQLLETQRESSIETTYGPGATLSGIAAAKGGSAGARLNECGRRLASSARVLEARQERNATLLLGAMRLRERWMNMLGGMSSPTYGSGGRQEFRQTRGIVWKSA